MSIPNRYKVPKKLWNKWCPKAQYIFDEVYTSKSIDSEDGKIADKCYWNAAVLAACEVNLILKYISNQMLKE